MASQPRSWPRWNDLANSSAEPPERFRAAPVARLATVRPDGRPHQIPVVFACRGSLIYLPIDHKPKQGRSLQRLTNIAHQPKVSLLVDHYDQDWSALWWVRVDGDAEISEDDAVVAAGHDLLREKYAQYQTVGLEPLMITVRSTRVVSWSAS